MSSTPLDSPRPPGIPVEPVPENPSAAAPRAISKRVKMFLILGSVVALCGLMYGAYWTFIGSRYVSTDNAYTAAEIAQVTPSVEGIIKEIRVVDTQRVKQGDILVVLDRTDAQLAVDKAQAQLGQAERRVKGYLANDDGLSAQIRARDADGLRAQAQLQSAQADLSKAQVDLTRRQTLSKSGSVSGEELSNAQNAFATAQANVAAAKAALAQANASRAAAVGSLKANVVLTADATLATNPEVALAKSQLDQARVDLERTVIRAPIDGVVAKRQAQMGQKVPAGAPLVSIVPVDEMHVDANFKEVQLTHVKVGQPVEMTSDLHGSSVVYHGVVDGFSGGTGSAFALIPAQNATGNWIKVVQRLPVRVTLDPEELKKNPLQVGLSMDATIDTRPPNEASRQAAAAARASAKQTAARQED